MKIRSPLLADALRVMNIVLPTAIGNALEYVPVCVAMALVGHGSSGDSASELDAVALARAYFNMVAMAPGFGLITALPPGRGWRATFAAGGALPLLMLVLVWRVLPECTLSGGLGVIRSRPSGQTRYDPRLAGTRVCHLKTFPMGTPIYLIPLGPGHECSGSCVAPVPLRVA